MSDFVEFLIDEQDTNINLYIVGNVIEDVMFDHCSYL